MRDILLRAYDQPPTNVHPLEAVFDFPALPITAVYRQYVPLLACHVAEWQKSPTRASKYVSTKGSF
jgi:hypothetical protein